jgi:hypothetical protein
MSLYGAFVSNSNQTRYVYERADGPSGLDAKLASVNHVTRDPSGSIECFQKLRIAHSEYVKLGSYVGPDLPHTFENLERRKRNASRSSTKGSKPSKPSKRSFPKGMRH